MSDEKKKTKQPLSSQEILALFVLVDLVSRMPIHHYWVDLTILYCYPISYEWYQKRKKKKS